MSIPEKSVAANAADRGPVDAALRRFAIATAPSLAWTFIGLPFDVIRVRLQVTSRSQFRGPLDCLRQTVKLEGVRALWKGFLPHILIAAPYSTFMFGTFNIFRPSPLPANADASSWRRYFGGVFVAGCLSGVVLTTFQNPLDVWRTRVQVSTKPLHGAKPPVSQGAKSMESNFLKLVTSPQQRHLLFRGLSMTATRNIPGNGVFFTVNELTLSLFDEPTAGHRLLAGAITGVVFNLAFMPADAIKARMMVSTPADGGVIAMAKQIVREHGFRGFWRGGLVMFAKAAPVNAAGFWTLHMAQMLLDSP